MKTLIENKKLFIIIFIILFPILSCWSQLSTTEKIHQLKEKIEEGEYNEPQQQVDKIIEEYKQRGDTLNGNYAYSLYCLAKINKRKGYYAKADSLLDESLSIIETKETDKISFNYHEILNERINIALEASDFILADSLIEKALAIKNNSDQRTGKENIKTLLYLAQLQLSLAEFDKAAKTLESSDALIKTLLEDDYSIKYLRSQAYGNFHYYKGEYKETEKYVKQTLDLAKLHRGESHSDYTGALLGLSSVYGSMGQFDKAIETLSELISLVEEKYGRDSHIYEYIGALSNLGGLLYYAGDYNKAEQHLNRSLKLCKETLGENTPIYFNALNILAILYQELGLLEKAEGLFLESLELRKGLYGENHPSYSNALHHLATFYVQLGNYKRAIKYNSEAIDILRKTTGEKTEDYALRLITFADICHALGESGKAVDLYQEAIEILNSIPGSSDYNKLILMNNHIMALESIDEANINDVEELYNLLLEVKELVYGTGNMSYAVSLANFALFYAKTKQFDKASDLYLKAIDICKNHSEVDRLTYSKFIFTYATTRYFMGDYETTYKYYQECFEIIKNDLVKKFLFLSEEERALYYNTVEHFFSTFQSFSYTRENVVDSKSDYSTTDFAYNTELLNKSILLNTANKIRYSILNSDDEALKGIWSNLLEIKMLLAKEEFQKEIDDESRAYLELQITEMERAILAGSKDYRDLYADFGYTWENIKEVLESSEAAIEIVKVNSNDFIKEEVYFALVLRNDFTAPQQVKLGTEEELKVILQNKENGKELYKKVWVPLETYLKGVTTVYIAPTGIFHTVPFAAIKKENKYLIDDYIICNVLSTKDIFRIKENKKGEEYQRHIALFGGVDFDLLPEELSSMEDSVNNEGLLNLTRSMLDYMESDRGQGFRYLPGSKTEVEQIKQYLTELNWKVFLYIGKEATEARFKSFSSFDSPEVLHVSTHGFYFPLIKNEHQDKRLTDASDFTIYRVSDNPLMRSGLAFSGANYVWRGKDLESDREDEILTAYEISNMNLTNTELVVLSACKTGLGDIVGAEGVYGLQRAFRLAGVESMIVTLWNIQDKETVQLMSEFYKQWTKGNSLKAAFSKAQKMMRHKYPDNPTLWAGFVLIE